MINEFKLQVPWLLTFILSWVYLASFVIAAFRGSDSKEYQALLQSIGLNQDESGLLLGFCVWAHPKTPIACPGMGDGCGCFDQPLNSHNFAFLVDMIMMTATGVLWWRHAKKRNASIISVPYWVVYLVFLVMCLTHGVAHLWLFLRIECARFTDIGPILTFFGYFVLVVLVLCIAFVCFRAILRLGTCSAFGLSLVSAGITSLVIYIVVESTSLYWSIQCVFVVTHPLACGIVLYSARKDAADQSWLKAQRVGWAFMIATIVGVLELNTCLDGFRAVGGHFWYDFWLGVALICALPCFRDPDIGSEEGGVGEGAPLTEESVARKKKI